MDGEDIQKDAVLDGQPSGGDTSDAPPTPALTREDVTAMLRDFGEEFTKRSKQSTRDVISAERDKGRQPQSGPMGLIPPELLATADDATKVQMYENLIKTQNAQQIQAQQQAQRRQSNEQFDVRFVETNKAAATRFGLDPDDKRLDYGEGGNYLERVDKFNESVVKALSADRNKATKDADRKATEDVDKAARDAGLEGNAAPGAASLEDDKAFMQRWSGGDAEATPENQARATKILNSRE